jgi:hypothetical protein
MDNIDRTEHIEEIFGYLRLFAKKDLRIAQIFENVSEGDDIFYMENDEFLKRLKALL